MAGKTSKDLRLSPRTPKLKRNQLQNSVNVLEEEVKRLKNELTQVRAYLKIERVRAIDLTYALQEKDNELQHLQREYDQQMGDIIAKLLLLEGDFRKEKQEIAELLEEKDATIASLNSEALKKNSRIESLQKKLESIEARSDKGDDKCKLQKKFDAQKQEIDRLRNANARLLESLSHVRLGHSNSHHKGKVRRGSTPSKTHGKSQLNKSEVSEWKEELSAFF